MSKPFVPDWVTDSHAEDPVQDPLHTRVQPPGGGPFIPDWLKDGSAPAAKRKTPPGITHAPLLVRGGQVLIPRKGIFNCDIRMENGLIQTLGVNLPDDGCEIVDASGSYVVPGIIDPHVHIGIFSSFDEEVISETRSAVVNGVTTVGSYFSSREPYLDQIEAAVNSIDNTSFADVFLHLPIFTYEQLEELPLLYKRYGISSFKAYMAGIPGMIPSLDEGFILDLMEAVASLGDDAVLNIHAENYHIVEWASDKLRKKKSDIQTLADWEGTHPGYAEAEAVQRALFLSRRSGARIYFVHISSEESLSVLREARRGGQKFFAETTSPYLTLTSETAGPEALMIPPIRSKQDQDELWNALSEELIQTIGTDHTPLTLDVKNAKGNLWNAMPGYPGVGTHLPSLLHEARIRHFPIIKLIEAMTVKPAEIFGLYPRKGTILPGSDADLVIIDLERTKTVSPAGAASRSDFALHQDRRVTGWPVQVIKSGQVITPDYSHDLIARTGRYVSRYKDTR